MAKKKTSSSHVSAQIKAERAENRAKIESEIKAMASTANARLRALERNNLTRASNAYRYIENRHFDKDTAIAQDRSGRIKFDTALKKKTASQLTHEKTMLRRFLYQAQTSSVKGTRAKYDKAYATFIDHHKGLNIDRATFDRVASTEGFRAFVRTFGSSQIAPLMSAASRAVDQSEESLKRITDAIAQVVPSMSIDEFNKQALPPSEWLYNGAEEEDAYIPDASAWGQEDSEGFMILDDIDISGAPDYFDDPDYLPKKEPTKKSGKRRKR